jgi:Raf kinase inhibitor-like YbhB/YbcL family protein
LRYRRAEVDRDDRAANRVHTYTVVNVVERVAQVLVAAVAIAGCGGGGGDLPTTNAPATIRLQSPQFKDGGTIPRAFTCDGGQGSPALRWSGVPDGTRELALTVDDPDAPGGDFEHWTLWHIGPTLRAISAGRPPAGSRTTKNGAGTNGWTDPCPPNGDPPHHYVFTLYALKEPLTEPNGADASEVRAHIARATTATGKLTARYGR